MALLEYKIVRFSHKNRNVKAVVRIYRGSFQNVQQQGANGMVTVNRYVRAAKVLDRVFEYDVPRDMTREEFLEKARAYLNEKLIAYAQANGHTVVTEQQDVSALEAVSNEKVT